MEGNLHVKRGDNPLSRLLATILGMPKEGMNCPVRVVSKDNYWSRSFNNGASLLRTKWSVSKRHGLVEEKFFGGLFNVGSLLKPIIEDGKHKGFTHNSKAIWMLGVRIPGVVVDGKTVCHDDGKGWLVDVAVKLPLVGHLIGYKGDVYVVEK